MFDRDFIVLALAKLVAGPAPSLACAELAARIIELASPRSVGDATRGGSQNSAAAGASGPSHA